MSDEKVINSKSMRTSSKDDQLNGFIDSDTKVVVSFDGGGIRGLMSIVIAAALEKASGVPLAQCCDLMIGTSIGGVNALLLSTPSADDPSRPRFAAADLVKDYKGLSRKIFNQSLNYSINSLWGFQKSRYSHAGFKEVAEECFGDKLISEAITRVIVTGVEIEKYMPLLMKSYAPPDFYMKEAALSTAAAPTYFPVSVLNSLGLEDDKGTIDNAEGKFYVVDGAIAAVNDPALLGYIELCELFKNQDKIKEKVIVISIGTGKTHRTIQYDEIASGGYAAWMPFIMPFIMELTSEVTDYQLRGLLKDLPKADGGYFRRYWRLQPIIPEEYLSFSEVSDIKLKDYKNIAENYVREHKREIEILGKILSLRAQYLKKKI